MSDTITVKTKKELAELLMSGGEWEAQDNTRRVCFYDEHFVVPFRQKKSAKERSSREMVTAWDCDKWRKVKYQPKHNEVVLAWGDIHIGRMQLGVFNKYGLYSGDGDNNEKADVGFQNYAPYTGTIPPHIQKFLDRLESR